MSETQSKPKIAIFCVGNRLHLDDGVGPAVYDVVKERFDVPENVDMFDLGVLTMDMINYVETCDAIITVDAMEFSGEPAGTVLRGSAHDLARAIGTGISLHDLRLADLFDAAIMLGYECEGVCLGVQVEETQPEYLTEDLSPVVKEALPLLVETLCAEMARLGSPFISKETGEPYLG